MPDVPATPGGRAQVVELYTDRLVIRGALALGDRRAAEVLNDPAPDYLPIEAAGITPLDWPGQVRGPERGPILVRRALVRYVALNSSEHAPGRPGDVLLACYGFLGAFVFHGHLVTRPGTPLLDALQAGGGTFVPFARATVYRTAAPSAAPRVHPVIVVNRAYLEALYGTG